MRSCSTIKEQVAKLWQSSQMDRLFGNNCEWFGNEKVGTASGCYIRENKWYLIVQLIPWSGKGSEEHLTKGRYFMCKIKVRKRILWLIWTYIYQINAITLYSHVSLNDGDASEKCVGRQLSHCASIIEYTYRHRDGIAYCTSRLDGSLLLLDYKPIQQVTVLNTVGNHYMVSICVSKHRCTIKYHIKNGTPI